MAEKSSGSDKKERSAAEMRKINKPLMEKKRRERINNCLNQLKLFLMDATKKDSSYYSKLEKADILEMTVKYLKNLQRQHLAVAMATDPKVVSKYSAGYTQCASEVTRYLSKMDGFNPEIRNRLVNHLSNCVNKVSTTGNTIQGLSQGLPFAQGSFTLSQGAALSLASSQPMGMQFASTSSDLQPLELNLGHTGSATPASSLSGSSSNMLLNSPLSSPSSSQQTGQQQNFPVVPVQLIPAKLPSGDVVFLLTNTQNTLPVTNLVTPVSLQAPSAGTSVATTSTSSMSLLAAGCSSSLSGLSTSGLPASGFSASGFTPTTTSVAVVPPQVHLPRVTPPVKSESDLLSPVKAPQPSTSGLQLSFPFMSGNLSDHDSSSPSGSEKDTHSGKPHTVSRYEDAQKKPNIFDYENFRPHEKDVNDNVADCDNQNNNNVHNNNNNNNPAQQQEQNQPQQLIQYPNIVGDANALMGPMWRPW